MLPHLVEFCAGIFKLNRDSPGLRSMLLFVPVLLGAFTMTIIALVMAFDARSLAHASGSPDWYEAGNIDSFPEATSRSAIKSDDFNSCQLDTGIWTHIDPDGDTILAVNHRQLSLSIPPSTTHTIWNQSGNLFEKNAPRIMQQADNTDFEIEAKFDTQFSQTLPVGQFQMQGALIEEDFDDVMRFEFFRAGSNTSIFAATFKDGMVTVIYNTVITGSSPIYMHVARVNDEWTQSYSPDGENWIGMPSFTHPISVTAVGVYAGNQNAPNEVLIDYFYNSDDPGTGDHSLELVVNPSPAGSGTVALDPIQCGYQVNDEVELTAIANPGWRFDSWSGDLSGSINPISITIDSNKVVTANFKLTNYYGFLPLVVNN